MKFDDIARRMMALRSYPWIYRDKGTQVPMSADGFTGGGREGRDADGKPVPPGPTYEAMRK